MKIKDTSIKELTEQGLLDQPDVLDTYKSIYDMGNPYELCDEECEDIALAREIIELSQPEIGEINLDKWIDSSKNRQYIASQIVKTANLESVEGFKYDLADDLAEIFSLQRGYRERLKESLNLDLDLFDKNILKNKCENAKILYLLYMLEKKHFPTTNILELLSKPSMENIDNSLLGMKTYNGDIIAFIKNSLEKEMSLYIKTKLQKITQSITFAWDELLENASSTADRMADVGYIFAEKGSLFIFPVLGIFARKSETKYAHSPIETLYLKILQHEYSGNILNILEVNSSSIEFNFAKRSKFIDEMKMLNNNKIDINSIEKYIDDNIYQIAKYVYLKEKSSRDERNKILNCKKKLRKFLSFCFRAKPLLSIKDNLTELWIVSILQAILDHNDSFKYKFPLYNNYS